MWRSTIPQVKSACFSNLTDVIFGIVASKTKNSLHIFLVIKEGCIQQVSVFLSRASMWTSCCQMVSEDLFPGAYNHLCAVSTTNCDENKHFFHMPLRILVHSTVHVHCFLCTFFLL